MTHFRILHAISQIPDVTGSGIYISAMIREARLKGHDNYLLAGVPGEWVAPNPVFSEANSGFVRFDGKDLDFPVVGMSDAMPYRSRRFKDLTPSELTAYEDAFGRALKDSENRFAPHVIHCHHLWVLAATVKKHFGHLPVTATCHGSDLRQAAACPEILERVAPFLRKLDAVMALSCAQKREIQSVFAIPAEKIFVTGAGYDAQRFRRQSKPVAPPVELLFAGKISKAKGVEHLMAALLHLDSDFRWRLKLAGGGHGREKEDILAKARSVGASVDFLGPLAQKELARKMAESHIFVLPSLFEGLPLVLLEAAACGCRIVSTALPGAVEVFGGRELSAVSFVTLPPLIKVDRVDPQHADEFEKGLARALEGQIRMVMKENDSDFQEMEPVLSGYQWPAVFKRVEAVYGKIAAAV